jgi:hypothetical protein
VIGSRWTDEETSGDRNGWRTSTLGREAASVERFVSPAKREMGISNARLT